MATARAGRTAASSSPGASEPEGRRGPFAAVQLEFGFILGPTDGRYLTRADPDAVADRVIVLNTLGAPQRRLLSGRRGRLATDQPDPAPVPTARVTVARAEPFADDAAAAKWLGGVRRDRRALATELEAAVAILNGMLRAHRAVVADPFVREVRGDLASARRVGYGEGVAIAGGRLDASVDLPPEDDARRGGRDRMSPQERLAATLGGRAHVLACEELVLRARLDLGGQRGREAALQARIALETLLAELASDSALERDRGQLEAGRTALAAAANTALDGELDDARLATVRGSVELMERVLARRRATGG